MQKIILLLKKLRHLFPQSLPIGPTQWEAWVKDIFATHNIPDMPNYRQAIAAAVMHLNAIEHTKPVQYFVRCVRKQQANQVAYDEIARIRETEKLEAQKQLAELAAAKPEVRASEPLQNISVQNTSSGMVQKT